ncbi:M16 family metallopeptidase [Hymenobacter profundi]|uniref:Insulinase family protein n=1 Tax=Hymenobacter profundi TaxID=1982110 RepID=A0ABS6WTL0_9BACT|nr:pitrilysin family protein [Hymenobacter profundi]MBW3126927.1 insulinase family protein [Hymenobacter profundi]MBW3127082.1 insulinase family protein [Hymenobacter profundi]
MRCFGSFIRLWPLVAALLPTALPSAAQSKLPEGLTRVASVEGITEYQLKNGLRVLLFPDNSKPTTTVNITYLVGSRHEGYGETGMAHLLEHMAFKGSAKHKNIPQELTEHGARPNGTTWYDRTNYFETFSATDENLNWALDLEADRMVNSFIDAKDLATEFSVVRNEFEMGENSPSRVLMERVLSSAYIWHNYGKSTIGSKEDIERVPINNLKAFYQKYYQPDNAVLVVAGKMDEAKTLALVDKYFSPIQKPTRQLPQAYTTEPTQDGERSVTLRRVGDAQSVAVAYHTPAGAHPDYATLDVLMDVLTNEPSGRLYKALIDSKKAAYTYGWTPALHDPGFAFFYTEVRKEQSLDSARTTMLHTLDMASAKEPTAEEVDRAKTKLLTGIELLFKNTDRVGLDLSEWIAAGDWRLVFLYRDNIRKVKPADVQRVANAYLKPSNRTVGTFIPEQKPDRSDIPETPNVLALVKDYKGEKAVAAGEAFDASPANIEARTKRGEEGKGTKYAVLPKSTRGNSVNVQLTLRYGDEKSLANKPGLASLTASMLERGTKTRSYQQIRDELDKLKARAYVYGGSQSAGVVVEASKENLPAVMKIVTDYLKNPTFPEAEFNKLKQERLVSLESQKQEPDAIAFNTSQRVLNPYPKGHPLYVMTFDEEIDALKATTVNDVRQFYKDFYGAENATVAVVGATDEAAVQKLVKTDLGKWKANKPYARIVRNYQDVKAGKQSVQANDKANAVYVAGFNLPMRDDDPDYPALVLGNYLFGGGFLNSRLATRVRQKEGISYGIGSQVSADSRDKLASYMVYAIYNPENNERLEKAIQEEFATMSKTGFSADEIKAAKSGWLQSRSVSRAQDDALAGRLNSYLDLNRTLAWDADFEKKVAALTPEQVNAAVKKYLDYNKLVFVEAGDFEKAKKTLAEKKAKEPAYRSAPPAKP